MNEPNHKLTSELADIWSARIFAIVQRGFTGRIVYKGAFERALAEDKKPAFSGYRYIGCTIIPQSSNLEEYRQQLSRRMETFGRWAKEGSFEPMITEFGIWGLADKFTENQKANALGIVFEEGSKAGIKAFIVLDPPIGGNYTQIKGTVLEQTIKKYLN